MGINFFIVHKFSTTFNLLQQLVNDQQLTIVIFPIILSLFVERSDKKRLTHMWTFLISWNTCVLRSNECACKFSFYLILFFSSSSLHTWKTTQNWNTCSFNRSSLHIVFMFVWFERQSHDVKRICYSCEIIISSFSSSSLCYLLFNIPSYFSALFFSLINRISFEFYQRKQEIMNGSLFMFAFIISFCFEGCFCMGTFTHRTHLTSANNC
jgi:hypothetical protein